MSTRGLLVATGLLFLMLGALSFLQKKTSGTERGLRESKRMTLLPVRDADRLELKNAKGKFTFHKSKGGDWTMLKPVETGADATAIGQLLSEVQFVEKMQTFPRAALTEANLQTFGLGQATRSLVATTPEGVLQVQIGRETPIPGGIYARVQQPGSGEELLVVQNQLAEAMDKDLNAWREKRVFPLVVPDITELRMRQGALEVEIQKAPEGAWMIQKPLDAPADPASVTSLLGEISALRATDFVTDSEGDLALYGLTAPVLSFQVKSKATNRVLQIGQANSKDTNQVYARMADRPFVFTLPKSSLEPLGKLPDRVRDRRLVTMGNPESTLKIEFVSKGGEYRLEKQGGRWMASWGGSNQVADETQIHRWLNAVIHARANRFLSTEDPAKLGFTKPRLSTSLSWSVPSTNGSAIKTETLCFGEETEDEVYVQNSAITGVMATTVDLIRETPESALGWLDRRLLPKDFGPLKGFAWASGGQRRDYRTGEDGRWRPVGTEADIPEAAGYAARALDLEVIRWTGVPVSKDFSKPEVEVVAEGQWEKKIKITVGRILADGTAPIRRKEGILPVSSQDNSWTG